MAGKSFNYSKWDNIELSDDESDLHPNIDKESWFRLKHRTRLEREEKEDIEVREINGKNIEDEARVKMIQARLKGVQSGEVEDAEFVDTESLEIELQELQQLIEERKKRVADIQNRRMWNIDNICKVKEEKTMVNKATSVPLKADLADVDVHTSATAQAVLTPAEVTSAPAKAAAGAKASTAVAAVPRGAEPAQTIQRERMSVISYNDYCIKHEALLEKYSEIQDLEATKDFLFKHCDVLLHEHAQSYILLSCLEDEMNGKHKRMKLVCRQSQILSHIHELGTSMRRDPRDVILPFFHRISEKEYLANFISAVNDFIVKIQKRAVEKHKEMDAAKEEEEDPEYEVVGEEGAARLGPGGLDPLQVLKSLPKALRQAFESQDIARLQRVLSEMDPQEAKHCMKQCVDSGLWVAKDPTVFDEGQDGDDEDAEDELAEAKESEEIDD